MGDCRTVGGVHTQYSHRSSLPCACPASLHLTSPHLTSPHLTSPHLQLHFDGAEWSLKGAARAATGRDSPRTTQMTQLLKAAKEAAAAGKEAAAASLMREYRELDARGPAAVRTLVDVVRLVVAHRWPGGRVVVEQALYEADSQMAASGHEVLEGGAVVALSGKGCALSVDSDAMANCLRPGRDVGLLSQCGTTVWILEYGEVMVSVCLACCRAVAPASLPLASPLRCCCWRCRRRRRS